MDEPDNTPKQRLDGDQSPVQMPALKAPQHELYFYHIVDSEKATLQVKVLGSDLGFTFEHNMSRLPPARIARQLEKKVTGCLIHIAGERRTVLAWAESGHGAGPYGDVSIASPGALANRLWTKRVVDIARLLQVNLKSPYDFGRGGDRTKDADAVGRFHGGHVEVKLVAHALYVLLVNFKILRPHEALTMGHLARLAGARWSNGDKPSFEVMFSRKSCQKCAAIASRLERATGIKFRYAWKDRLVPMVYESRDISRDPLRRRLTADQLAEDLEGDGGDDARSIVSISSCSTEGTVIGGELSPPASSTSPATLAQSLSFPVAESSDGFIDGIAFSVGQIDKSPSVARMATVDLAEYYRRHSLYAIKKPVPGTAVLEAPDEQRTATLA